MHAAVSLAFFISGAAGLIFQFVWLYRCTLALGSSVHAVSIVLSSFMSGLALGNALVGRYGSRIRNCLYIYAVLELIVAVTGVAAVYVLPQLANFFVPAARRLIDIPWALNALRGASALTLLIVPTTAMGATLPVLIAWHGRERGEFGRALGRLYGWNTLGAVVGVLFAELVLLVRLGASGTAWFAALLSLSAACVAFLLSRRVEGAPVREDSSRNQAIGRVWPLLICAFLAGGCLLAQEVLWFRFLSMFVLNSTLSFSLMLAVVLGAIGLGGLATSAWLRVDDRAWIHAPTVAVSMALVSATSYVTFQILTGGLWTTEWNRILWLAIVLTFSTSFLSGVFFTLVGGALKRHVSGDARAAGWLTLANTSGATAGPLVATFALLPLLGTERSLFAIAIVYCFVGVLGLADAWPMGSTSARRAFVAATTVAVLVLVGFPFGLMTDTYFVRATERYATDGSRIVATREGSSETILLMRRAWLGVPIYDRLVTNGFSMSGTHLAAARYMRYFAYWPLMLHERPLRRVLVVCYGVGVTAAAATDVKSVESIDVVEISGDVIAINDKIAREAQNPLHDARVRLHVEDGRQFLQISRDRFDLITGEPPPPLTPGTVNLYTREYFQLMYDRLADGGMATYWLPVPPIGEYNLLPIIRAFCDVFSDCSLWNGTPFDWMLVGTRGAQGPVPEAAFSRPWTDPVIGPRLREIGFELPEQVGATFLGDASYLKKLTAGTPSLTDDFPRRLVPASGGSGFGRHDEEDLKVLRDVLDTDRARTALEQSVYVRGLLPATMITGALPFFEAQRIINRVMEEGGNPVRYIDELHALLTKTSLRRLPLWMLGSNDALQRVAERSSVTDGRVAYEIGLRALSIRNYAAAASYLAAAERQGFQLTRIPLLRAYSLCMAGQVAAARQLAPQVEPGNADERHFWRWMVSQFAVGPT